MSEVQAFALEDYSEEIQKFLTSVPKKQRKEFFQFLYSILRLWKREHNRIAYKIRKSSKRTPKSKDVAPASAPVEASRRLEKSEEGPSKSCTPVTIPETLLGKTGNPNGESTECIRSSRPAVISYSIPIQTNPYQLPEEADVNIEAQPEKKECTTTTPIQPSQSVPDDDQRTFTTVSTTSKKRRIAKRRANTASATVSSAPTPLEVAPATPAQSLPSHGSPEPDFMTRLTAEGRRIKSAMRALLAQVENG